MSRVTSAKLLSVGSIVSGAGASAVVGFAIEAVASSRGFFNPAGVISVAILAFGLLVVLAGVVVRDAPEPEHSQVQRGGRGSTNIQAGRDVTIRDSRAASGGPEDPVEALRRTGD